MKTFELQPTAKSIYIAGQQLILKLGLNFLFFSILKFTTKVKQANFYQQLYD
jgi:hypothetical protein